MEKVCLVAATAAFLLLSFTVQVRATAGKRKISSNCIYVVGILGLPTALQLCRGLSVYPHFVGRLLFIYSRYCSFSLNIHNSRTDYFPKMRLAVHERKRFEVRCDICALFQDFCLSDFFKSYCLCRY